VDSARQENLSFLKKIFFLFLFFLLSLFAPLNGIEQIEDTHGTPHSRFLYLLLCPTGTSVTQPCLHGDFVQAL
jgi:hypothetical protein